MGAGFYCGKFVNIFWLSRCPFDYLVGWLMSNAKDIVTDKTYCSSKESLANSETNSNDYVFFGLLFGVFNKTICGLRAVACVAHHRDGSNRSFADGLFHARIVNPSVPVFAPLGTSFLEITNDPI